MNREDIIRMAREAQLGTSLIHKGGEQRVWIEGADWHDELERFHAIAVAAEREKVAAWMRSKSYATGHGDTIEDLLKELEWQVAEREREACAKVAEEATGAWTEYEFNSGCMYCAKAIRARGEA